MTVDVILGLQWGDEGKGKIVDCLTPEYDIVARFQGGPNAGHTLIFGGKKFVLHTIPSGIFREKQLNVIGNGVVLDPTILKKEIETVEASGLEFRDRLYVSLKTHLILPTHKLLDAASEHAKGKTKIGSTLKGIGPTYMDKTGRNGLRVGNILEADFKTKYNQLKEKHLRLLKLYPEVDFDLEKEEALWFDGIETLLSLQQVNCEYFINDALRQGKRVLAEGAQGTMLDVDFGTYPFVTSSNTITAGVCTGLGIAPSKIGDVIGITKAYCTRVGSGPFPTELFDETGTFLQKEGHEFGATTGRARRCGWIDLPQLRYTVMINGVTKLAITKLDVLNKLPEIMAATSYNYKGENSQELPFCLTETDIEPVFQAYDGWEKSLEGILDFEDLPPKAKAFLGALEAYLEVPVAFVSTGPDRVELIVR